MATLKDIAEKAGVTVSTVSKALNGNSEIAGQTKERICEIAKELGYTPRSGYKVQNNHIIGVIIPDMKSEFFSDMLVTIDQNLCDKGYMPLYVPYSYDDDSYKKSLEICRERQVDGIIAICFQKTMRGFLKDFLLTNPIPIVMIAPIGDYNFVNCVNINASHSLAEAVKYFLQLGKNRIALITDRINYNIRCDEFKYAFQKNNIVLNDSDIHITEERFELGGYKCMKNILSETPVPNAILAGYDRFAIGAIRAIQEKGMQIPGDIAICGIDNISMDNYLTPTLSSIGSPIQQMIRVGIDYLTDSIREGDSSVVYNTVLNAKLVIRESIG